MEKSINSFGDYVLQKRLELGFSLREFCRKFGYAPSYISRLENSILSAPSDKEKLKTLAFALGIKEETKEWALFFSLASSSRIVVPKDIQKDFPNVVKFLPAFFRTTQKDEMSKKDISNLVKLIHNDSNS